MFAPGGQQLPCHLCQQQSRSSRPPGSGHRQLLTATGFSSTSRKQLGGSDHNHWRIMSRYCPSAAQHETGCRGPESEAPVSKTYTYKKITKPLLERKRRARINACLDELKDIMTVRKQIDSIAISLSVDIIVEFDKF